MTIQNNLSPLHYYFKLLFVVCMHFEHQVTRKTGYITNSIYTRGTRDEHRLDQGGCTKLRNEIERQYSKTKRNITKRNEIY